MLPNSTDASLQNPSTLVLLASFLDVFPHQPKGIQENYCHFLCLVLVVYYYMKLSVSLASEYAFEEVRRESTNITHTKP